jgi:hypothetical protein
MRRLFETGRIIDLFIVPYRSDLQTVKSQKSGVIGNAPAAAWLVVRSCCFQITEMLLVTGTYLNCLC